MKKKIKYSDEPMGRVKKVVDFLPRPEDLVFKEDTIKITLALSRQSVDYFKKEAKRHGAAYQQMIRTLVDEYAVRHERAS
jgi:hypothetical protein